MNSLLPPGSSQLERRAAEACAGISDLNVPLRDLWNPARCPVKFLPYLAWAFSVDRWDEKWTAAEKRKAVTDAFYIHRRKGTVAAIRRVIEAMGFSMSIAEWWSTHDTPGTFDLTVDVSKIGISDELRKELERVVNDTKPVSRHMKGLSISNTVQGIINIGCVAHFAEVITVYPDGYIPESDVTYNGSIKYIGNHTYSGKNYG